MGLVQEGQEGGAEQVLHWWDEEPAPGGEQADGSAGGWARHCKAVESHPEAMEAGLRQVPAG